MMENYITYVKMAGAAICGAVTFIWGGMDTVFAVLLCLMGIDYVTGILSAVRSKTLSSEVGFYGLLKKIGMLLIVAVGHFIGVISGVPDVRSLVIGFYIANEGISILENAGRLGVPLPEKLVSVLKQLDEL